MRQDSAGVDPVRREDERVALTPDSLYETTQDILGSVVARLEGHGIAVPERQYVSAGEVAFDCCDQLVVTVFGIDHSMPGEQSSALICSPPRHATIDVWLTRCVPVPNDKGDPPSPSALSASASEILTDMWSLAYSLWEGYKAGDWGSACASVLLGPVTAVGPEGGCGGSHAQIELQLL